MEINQDWKVDNIKIDVVIDEILELAKKNNFCISLIHHLSSKDNLNNQALIEYGFLCQLSCTLYNIFITFPGMITNSNIINIEYPFFKKYGENITHLSILIIKSKLFYKNLEILDKLFIGHNNNKLAKEFTKIDYSDDIWTKLSCNHEILLETYQIYMERIIRNIYHLVDLLNNQNTADLDNKVNRIYQIFQNNNTNFDKNLI
jgi:hypothetical protein